MILLSHIIDFDTPSYGNRDKFIIEETSRITDGKSANSSKWMFSNNHLGTHVDVPKHFFDSGKTLTDYHPQEWIFKNVQLIDVPCDEAILINREHLEGKILENIDLLLIRTGYEQYRSIDKYWDDNPGLSPQLGFWLRKNFNIKAVGFDFISLTSWKFRDEGKVAHRAFLDPDGDNQPIRIIEDMKLSEVDKDIKKLIVAPCIVKCGNGSPVTVFCVNDFKIIK